MKKLIPLFAVIAFFAGMELLLAGLNQVFPWDAIVYQVGMRNKQFIYNMEFGKPTQYLRDPDLLWRLKPGWFRQGHFINKLGFRGGETTGEKPAATIRIVCMGNSCTFGARIDRTQDTYPLRLWQELREHDPQHAFEVINAGVNGYTTYQILQYWRRDIKKLNPDIVTVYSGFNNIVSAPLKEDKDLKMSQISCDVSNILLSLRFFRSLDAVAKKGISMLTHGEFISNYDEDRGILRRVSPQDYRKNLSELVRDAQSRNVAVVFITTPSRGDYPLCIVPRPEIIRDGKHSRIRWLPPDYVYGEWTEQVNASGDYQSELQSALHRIEQKSMMPANYFKAAYCYEQLGDSVNSALYYALSDSLDEDHHELARYNQIMREVAETYGVPLVDCEKALGMLPNGHLFVEDGIHPNEAGHALIADELFKTVNQLLMNSGMLTSKSLTVP